MREILLTNGLVALVDDEDYEKVCAYTWYAMQKGERWYVARTVREDGSIPWHLYLSRFILDAPDDKEVDHIDHNGLDNRRVNLRLATRSQNGSNRDMPQGENGSGFRGVSSVPSGRWRAKIIYQGTYRHIGTYDTAEEAARAYDVAAKELHGEFATLNFI